jgi:hypothetical protein
MAWEVADQEVEFGISKLDPGSLKRIIRFGALKWSNQIDGWLVDRPKLKRWFVINFGHLRIVKG